MHHSTVASVASPLNKAAEDHMLFLLAQVAVDRNDLSRAEELIKWALNLNPHCVLYLKGLGEILNLLQRPAEALNAYKQAATLDPSSADIYFGMGIAANAMERKDEAVGYYQKAANLEPDWAEVHFNLGTALHQTGRIENARIAFQKTVSLRPDWTAAWISLGGVLMDAGQAEQALNCWQKALHLEPRNSHTHYNYGTYYQAQGDFEPAITHFKRAIDISPEMIAAHVNLGKCLLEINCTAQAVNCFRYAVTLDPNHAHAWYGLAGALVQLNQKAEATACYRKVIQLAPDFDAAHYNLAVTLRKQERIDDAIAHCQQALKITPHFAEALVFLFQLAQHACDWDLIDRLTPQLDQLTSSQLQENHKPAESPMLSLRRHADPCINQSVARAWVKLHTNISQRTAAGQIFTPKARSHRKRIHIGYISQDFRDHAMAHHVRGLFEAHDRERFAIHGYACNRNDGSQYRPLLAAACDHFVELHTLSDLAAAHRICNDGIDILVDLMGHTQGNRMGILALRPSPIQVGYLGFLGTSGANFIDYFITDTIVTPLTHAPYYQEKLIFMPHCYQVNDNRLPIAAQVFKRCEFNLKNEDIAFCSFNQPYKIDKQTFAIWLNILKQVPHSVLWLLGQNPTCCRNLQTAALKAGIDPARLIFSGALRIDLHLARMRLADLALDTFPYNGGATTSNALWAGVPIVALLGNHLVSRMSASALSAIGLSQLITHSPAEYEKMAVDLALHSKKLRTIRNILAHQRLQMPLFNTRLFARHLESAFTTIFQRFINRLTPESFKVGS